MSDTHRPRPAQAAINEYPTLRPALYTWQEEVIHSLTHGFGAVLSAIGLVLLLALAISYGDVWQVISFAIYGSSLFLLYLASTLYHSMRHPRLKHIFRVCDHAAIYLLIAGTYTPFLLSSGIRESIGGVLFAVVWGLALMGVAFKTVFIGRYEKLATLGYVLMGWLSVLGFRQLMANVPTDVVIWLGIGGLVYTLGVIFYVWERLPYNHAIWHLFVLGGSACHFVAIFGLL